MTNPFTADMMEAWSDITPEPGVYRTEGMRHSIYVRDNMLHVVDQVREEGNGWKVRERTETFMKVGVEKRLRHLTITGTAGSFSSEARRWLVDVGATWVHFDNSADTVRVIGSSGGGIVKPHLVRVQAMCPDGLPYENTGRKIIRRFLTHKMEGQAWNAENLLGDEIAAKEIRESIDLMQVAPNQRVMRGHEGNAAAAYWEAWQGMRIPWKGPRSLREHWNVFPGRKTLVPVDDPKDGEEHTRDTNRGATDPVNAMLNTGYHVMELECTIALTSAGLIPELGISHSDKQGRSSFALDLIEVARPAVDEIILNLISRGLVKSNYMHDRVTDKVRLSDDFFREISARVLKRSNCLVPHVRETVSLLRSYSADTDET